MIVHATIKKGANAEFRVVRDRFMGREVIDLRVWAEPRQGGEPVRTTKGITFDVSKLPAVIAGLQAALPVGAVERSKEQRR